MCAVNSTYVIEVFVCLFILQDLQFPVIIGLPSTSTEYEVLGIHPVGTVDLL